ncbi:MAG: L,D-transpeptidase family protein [Hyphomicrobium sp.]
MKTLTVDWSGRSVRALAAATLMLAGTCGPVSAQGLLFDWGSSEKVDDSGREAVRIKTAAKTGEVLVSFGDRRVYLIVEPGKALSYPIAIPREQSRWSGVTSVSMKRENPGWTPTPEMLRENPRLPSWVPGGHPMNPLGTRALYLGASDYRIHGTDAPWTIGTAASKGCVRMYNKDVQDLYPRVRVGARVTVTWNTFEVTAITDAKELASVALFAPRKDDGKRSDTAEKSSEANGAEKPVKLVSVDASVVSADESGRSRSSSESRRKSTLSEAAAAESSTSSSGKSQAKAETRADGKPDTAKSEKPTAGAVESTAIPATASPPAVEKSAAAPSQTGSIASKTPSAAITPAQPSIDEATSRAMAAAERAAAAAERAAAAAEGLLAASRSQSVQSAPVSTPTAGQPADHASAADSPPKSP